MTDLDEFMAGPEPDWDAEPEPPTNADEVERLGRWLARIRRDIDAVLDQAESEMERIIDWRNAHCDALEGREAHVLSRLAAWHEAVLRDDPSRKTISLPSVKLSARVQQPEWDYDADVFTAWALEHDPSLLRIVESVDKTAAKKRLVIPDDAQPGDEVTAVDPRTGEVVPGVVVRIRPQKFTADPT
jgi:hypothetical protein